MRKPSPLLFILILLATRFMCPAQAVSGRVISVPDSSALAGVKITVAGTARTTETDGQGNFYFDSIPAGEFRLAFAYAGHRDTSMMYSCDSTPNQFLYVPFVLICNYSRSAVVTGCPHCHRRNEVIPIKYGFATSKIVKQAEHGELVLGGCMITGCEPWWHCKRCRKNF